ncbi:MAG: hypothetical protein ACRDI2_19960 [Chloroflexota bacterium]
MADYEDAKSFLAEVAPQATTAAQEAIMQATAATAAGHATATAQAVASATSRALPLPTVPPAPRQQTSASAPCLSGQIKANRNSGIYHAPGQRDYARTRANVACYDTEGQAAAAGYRPARR